jgi:DNA-directed RNA polymerase subunit RPC12/RpoP
VSGRILLRLDQGLGWTKPLTVARCAVCGAELARHPNPDRALRAARRRRCPACGTRSARRLPGTTSLAGDLALANGRLQPLGRRGWPPTRHVAPRSRPAERR